MGFSFANGKVWIRNYEVKEAEKLAEKETDIRLVEVGPRFCLTPIIIQEGSSLGL
jgi:ribosome biogenesis protein BRX1